MKNITSVLCVLCVFAVKSALALEFFWVTPTNGTPQGYVLVHWSANAASIEQYGIGLKTNCLYQGTLVDGANYFAVADYELINGELWMSSFSNVAVVTNTPALDLPVVVFGSTNLDGVWLPVRTNHMLIYPTQPEQFFRAGVSGLTRTNLISVLPTP